MYLIDAPKNEAEEFCNHVCKIFLRSHQASLSQDFQRHASAHAVSKNQLKILRKHASPSARTCLDARSETLWHMFNDYLKKGVTLFEMNPPWRQREILKEMVIYSQWTSHNFSLILDLPPLGNPPPYPALQDQIEDFPTALSYLEHSLVPALKRYISTEENISEAALEQHLEIFEKKLLRHVSGLEILKPIPAPVWRNVGVALALS